MAVVLAFWMASHHHHTNVAVRATVAAEAARERSRSPARAAARAWAGQPGGSQRSTEAVATATPRPHTATWAPGSTRLTKARLASWMPALTARATRGTANSAMSRQVRRPL